MKYPLSWFYMYLFIIKYLYVSLLGHPLYNACICITLIKILPSLSSHFHQPCSQLRLKGWQKIIIYLTKGYSLMHGPDITPMRLLSAIPAIYTHICYHQQYKQHNRSFVRHRLPCWRHRLSFVEAVSDLNFGMVSQY